MYNSRRSPLGFLTFVFGLVFGGLLTLLLSTNEKGETRDKVKGRVKDLKSRLREMGETEQIMAYYREAEEKVVAKVAQIKEKTKTINWNRYKEVIDDVVTEVKKESNLTGAQLKKLGEYLAEDYQKLTGPEPKNTKTKTAAES